MTSQDRKIQLLVIMDCLYDDAGGGTERQFLAFRDLCPKYGIDIHVCFLRHQKIHDQIAWNREPVTLQVGSLFSFSCLRAVGSVFRYTKRNNIQVIQTFFDDSAVFAGIMYSIFGRRLPPLTIGLRNSGHTHHGALRRLLNIAYNRADHFLVNAGFIASHLQNSFAIPPEKISIISNIFAVQEISVSPRLAAFEQNLRQSFGRIAVIVANLRPVKGIDVLLHGIALLKRDDIAYLVAGDGPLYKEYLKLATDLGIDRQVFFLGRRDDVPAILQTADFALLTSHSEGLSNTLLEYAFACLPIIATDVGGNSEIVLDGKNGLLVAPRNPAKLANAILSMLGNFQEFQRGADERQNRIVGEHTTDRVLVRTRDLYQALIENTSA